MPQHPGVVSFPIVKYSVAPDSPPSASKLAWRHITHDLVVVVDTFRASAARGSRPPQTLRVLHGMQVLDDIPLETLCREAQLTTAHCQQMRVELKKEQLSYFGHDIQTKGLAGDPIQPAQQQAKLVRRMQVKFKLDTDFDSVFDILTAIGLPLDAPQQRPSTAQPTPAQRQPPHIEPGPIALAGGGPSCLPPLLAEHSNRPFTANAAANMMANATYPLSRINLADNVPKVSSPLTQRPLTMGSSSGESLPSRPTSDHSTSAYDYVPEAVFPASSSGPSPTSTRLDSSDARPATARTDWSHTAAATTTEHVLSSSPTRPSFNVANGNIVPPSRELSFSRPTPPKSSGSDNIRPVSEHSSNLMPPPERPASACRPGSSTGPSSSSSTELPAVVSDAYSTSRNQNRRRSSSTRPLSSSSRAGETMTDLPPLPEPTFLQRNASDARPYTAQASLGANVVRKETEAENPRPQTASRGSHNPAEYAHLQALPSSANTERSAMDNVLAELKGSMPSRNNTSLDLYAAQSDENRMALLNDFIMQQLDNDDFIKLCEDVSVCWTRYGLGLE